MKKVYLPEEELIEMIQSSKIGWLEYVTSFSKEWDDEFAEYCRERGLKATEDSAQSFLEHKKELMEQGLEEGNM